MKFDLTVASVVNGIDIIVGGHSHLYFSGDTRDEKSAGVYPKTAFSPNGKPVLIVAAGFGGQQVGMLTAYFDKDGVIKSYWGGMQPMDASISPRLSVTAQIKSYRADIDAMRDQPLFYLETDLSLDENGRCLSECLAGETVTDILADVFSAADIVFVNAAFFASPLHEGIVSQADFLSAFPYRSRGTYVQMKGADILKFLDDHLGQSDAEDNDGAFLQAAGLSYNFDPARPAGERVFDVRTKDGMLDNEKIYTVLMPDFLVRSVQPAESVLKIEKTQLFLTDELKSEMEKRKFLSPVLKKRIQQSVKSF